MLSFRAFGDCSLGKATKPLSGVQTIQMNPLLNAELVIVDCNCGEGRPAEKESWVHSIHDMEGRQDAFRGRSLQEVPLIRNRIALF